MSWQTTLRVAMRVGTLAVLMVAPGVSRAARALDGTEITGRITDARTGSGVVAAQVVVRDAQGVIVAGAMTDSTGRYSISDVRAGTYVVESSRLGYARAAQTDVAVAERARVEVNLRLDVVALTAAAVVVTSTRRVERAADTDVSVTVIAGDAIARSGEPTVFGGMKHASGVDFFSSGLGQQQPNARGFVNPFTTNLLVLVDGRLASLPGLGTVLPGMMLVTPQDVAQVEVVTGPSSALYGANAANGVLSIVTRDPRDSRGGSISVTEGDRGVAAFSLRMATVITEQFAFKLTGESYQAKDFERRNAFAGSGGFSLLDQPDFQLSHQSAGGSLFYFPSAGNRLVYSAGATRANYINLTVAGRLQVKDWDASYQQLRANFTDVFGGALYFNTAYTRNDAGDSYYLDVLTRMQIPPANGGAGLSPALAMQRALFVDRSDRFEFEAQHAWHRGTQHFVTTGVMCRTSHPVSGGTYLTDGTAGAPIRINESGAYMGYDNVVIPKLRLTAVVRYDTHSDFSARFSPKLSASYTLANGDAVRLTYNEAFNSPTTYLLYAQSNAGRDATSGLQNWIRGNRAGFTFVNTAGGAVPANIPALEPLHVSSVELGYRATWGSSASLDVTAYYSTYRNYISKEAAISRPTDSVFVRDPTTGLPRREVTKTYLNYGELPVAGVDVAGEWFLDAQWSASGSLSYQQPGTFRKPRAGLTEPGFNAPTHKAKGAVMWHDWWRPGTRVELSGVQVSRFEFVSSLPYLTGPVPAYVVADAGVSVPVSLGNHSRARLELTAKNVLDRRHIEVPGGAWLGRLFSLSLAADW